MGFLFLFANDSKTLLALILTWVRVYVWADVNASHALQRRCPFATSQRQEACLWKKSVTHTHNLSLSLKWNSSTACTLAPHTVPSRHKEGSANLRVFVKIFSFDTLVIAVPFSNWPNYCARIAIHTMSYSDFALRMLISNPPPKIPMSGAAGASKLNSFSPALPLLLVWATFGVFLTSASKMVEVSTLFCGNYD